MGLIHNRIEFKPFEYQWAYDYWFQQQNAHWLHTEINMQKDIKDWNEELNNKEKNVIGEILKGFAQTECAVNDYWSGYVVKWFPKHEVKMMGVTFGSFETIHATAYSYLNDILGLDDFKSFMDDSATMERLEQLAEPNQLVEWLNTIKDAPDKLVTYVPGLREAREYARKLHDPIRLLRSRARSLAVFSAFAEGVSLFSQFAILLSFRKKNLLTGIGQQMIFSCRDESLHSEAGCKLYRELLRENPEIETDDFKAGIYEAADLFLQKEDAYIDSIFREGDLETITVAQIKNFLRDRANRKLKELGLDAKYSVDEALLGEMDWFYHMISGEQQTDFFFNRETGYARPNEDWNDDIF